MWSCPGVQRPAADDLDVPGDRPCARALWVVTGEDKAEALAQLLSGDEEIPAARVRTPVQTVLTDVAVTYS